MADQFDFNQFKAQAIKDLYAGKALTGENDVFAPLLKHFLETALQCKMDLHLQEDQATGVVNRRNGKNSKRVKSSTGEFALDTPRDRNSEFEPIAVPKRQVVLTEQLEHLQEIYGYSLSAGEISIITDKVIPLLREWQTRPLESV